MSFGGGGGGTQTVRTELDPAVRPFVEYGLREAKGLYESGGPQFYPGQTYIGPSAATQTGMQAATQLAQRRATYGDPLVQGAQQTVGALQTALNPALGAFGDVYNRSMYDPSTGFYSGVAGGGARDITSQARANQMFGQAAAGDPSAGFYSGLAGGQARDVVTQNQLASLYGQAGQGDPSAGFYQAMQAGQFGNAAMAPTSQTAAGAYLGGNPFFQGAFNPAARAAQDVFEQGIQGVTSQASRAGRYGSGAMGQLEDRAAGQFAQSLTDVAGQLAFQNYAAERGLQEAAMGRLGALSQQDIANRLTGAQQLSSGAQQTLQNQLALAQAGGAQRQQDLANQVLGAQNLSAGAQQSLANQLAASQFGAGITQQDLANQMAAAQQLTASQQQGLQSQLAAAQGLGSTAAADYARQLQAAAMAPELAAQDYADIQRLIDLGQMQESYQELALADAMNRFNFQQAAPQANLQAYLSAAYGSPMGAQTSQPIFRNSLGSALSGGLAGAALGGMAGFNPLIGGALGAGAGLLG